MFQRVAMFFWLAGVAVAADPVREAPRVVKPADQGVGRYVPDLTFTDVAGKAGKLSDYNGAPAIVVAFTSTSCPLSKKYAPTLAKLEQTYKAKKVLFLYVNPLASDGKSDINQARTTHQFQGAYIHDAAGTFAKSIGATSTTDVFVLDATRTILYHGAIDDQYGLGYSLDAPKQQYLVAALDEVLAGKIPTIAATTAPGCALDLDQAKTAPTSITYHAQIERLVQANCVECHRNGGVAPFALDTYKDVVAHAGMIKKVVEKGTMPPWFAAPPAKGNPSVWGNDRALHPTDKANLLTWLNTTDKPIGNPADAPKPRAYENGWQIGKPDAVFKPEKAVRVKATGTMPYQNVYAETNLTEDRWVQALEVRPSAKQVVHHVLAFVEQPRKPGERPGLLESVASDERHGYYAIYVPGNSALMYPDGFGKKLPKGSKIRFQIHYTPNGTATDDLPELGVIYAKKKPEHEVYVAGIVNTWFRIPPGADNHQVVSLLPVPMDVKLLSFLPHMHLRGKSYRYEVTTGGKTEVLLDVPNYDFNWQLQYKFAEPKLIPRGSLLKGVAHFDNSDKNPANPDPKKEVKWGQQTFDEMMLGYVEFYIVNDKK